MPRNVRNFWIETQVNGRSTIDASGPAAKDGGFTTTVKMRENGEISDTEVVVVGTVLDGVLSVTCYARKHGEVLTGFEVNSPR